MDFCIGSLASPEMEFIQLILEILVFYFANSVKSSSFYKSEVNIGADNFSLRLNFLALFLFISNQVSGLILKISQVMNFSCSIFSLVCYLKKIRE